MTYLSPARLPCTGRRLHINAMDSTPVYVPPTLESFSTAYTHVHIQQSRKADYKTVYYSRIYMKTNKNEANSLKD